MPQVHNKKFLSEGSGFGSKYMKSVEYSTNTHRKMQLKGELEKKSLALKVKLLTKSLQQKQLKWDRTEKRLKENMKRTAAYAKVVEENNISSLIGGPLYKRALDKNYTFKSLRFEVAAMMKKLEPSAVRIAETHQKVQQAKDEVDKLIKRNLRTLTSPRTKRRLLLEEQERARLEAERLAKEKTPEPPPQKLPFHKRKFNFGNRNLLPPIPPALQKQDEPIIAPPDRKRELTILSTKGVVGKAHFAKPDLEKQKTREGAPGSNKVVERITDSLKEVNLSST